VRIEPLPYATPQPDKFDAFVSGPSPVKAWGNHVLLVLGMMAKFFGALVLMVVIVGILIGPDAKFHEDNAVGATANSLATADYLLRAVVVLLCLIFIALVYACAYLRKLAGLAGKN
jgi:hypothetical protein